MRYLFFSILLLAVISSKGQISSENVTFNHGGCSFGATLTKPSQLGPYKVIVIVPGSGQNDRNGTIQMSGGNIGCLYPGLLGQTITIYKDLAENLSDSGYAVLRYDELTVSCPSFSGPLNYENLFLPALSAIDYLKSRADIDTNKIILIGHSEGAQLISYMAPLRKSVKATISLAGSYTPFDSILAYQLVYIAKTCGQDTIQAKTQAQQILAYFNMARNGTYNASTPSFGGVTPAVWEKYISVGDSVAIMYQANKLPSLFVGFGDDFNVPPSELIRFQQSLSGDFTFNSLAGLNHYMTPANDPEVARTVADTIVYWLNQKNIGLQEQQISQSVIEYYPNPVQQKLSIKFPESSSEHVLIKVVDLNGKEVIKSSVAIDANQTCEIDLNNLDSGIYLLTYELNGQHYSHKVVKT